MDVFAEAKAMAVIIVLGPEHLRLTDLATDLPQAVLVIG